MEEPIFRAEIIAAGRRINYTNRGRISRSNYAKSRRTFALRDTRQTVYRRNFIRPCAYSRNSESRETTADYTAALRKTSERYLEGIHVQGNVRRLCAMRYAYRLRSSMLSRVTRDEDGRFRSAKARAAKYWRLTRKPYADASRRELPESRVWSRAAGVRLVAARRRTSANDTSTRIFLGKLAGASNPLWEAAEVLAGLQDAERHLRRKKARRNG